MIPLALTRGDVADYVSALFIVYIILIFANILISCVPRMPYRPWLRAVLDFITETTNPYLNFFRRFLPPIGGGGFALDLSPIIGMIVLFVAAGRRRRPDRKGERRPPAPGAWPAPSAPLVVAARPGRQGDGRGAIWCSASRSTCSARSS